MEWFFDQKNKCFCIICKECRSDLIELHHIEPQKKAFNIYSGILNGIKLSAIKKELQKTAPLCKNHHRAYHQDILYESEKILYDFYVWIKHENRDWEEVDNLSFLLSGLSNEQVKFVNKFYGTEFVVE